MIARLQDLYARVWPPRPRRPVPPANGGSGSGGNGAGTGRGGGGDHQLLRRFGRTCPACGAALGAAPVMTDNGRFAFPPCFRLEVGPMATQSRRFPWRLSVVGHDFPMPFSTDPRFNDLDIDYVYLLCGGGHIFPDSAPVLDRPGVNATEHHVDEYNMIAAIGAPASGKTYLLLRTMHQNLDNPHNFLPAQDDGRIREYQLSPLEQIPMRSRSSMYAQTLAVGDAIEPTMMDRWGRPEGILKEQLPEVLDAIQDVIRRTVVDGQRRAAEWGKGFRQPLVMRTQCRTRRTWTGLADLPGEMFDPDDGSPRERVKLRDYDALVWVIDPLVSASMDRFAEDSLAEESAYTDVLDGSLRPGTTHAVGQAVVRSRRDHVQTEIGRRLTLLDGEVVADPGAGVQLLVAITKSDLLHAVLRKKDLDHLGQPGEVLRGVAGYLAVLTRSHLDGAVHVDQAAGSLLQYLQAGVAVDERVREARCRQVAEGLIRYYSEPGNFWNLAHEGREDHIDIPDGDDPACNPYTILVPSIGGHLDRAQRRDAIGHIQLRDVVMSALGCGITYGLGHEWTFYKLLREPWLRLRFFLCSPLGTVPRAFDDAGNPRLRPLESTATFPRLQDRSAALSQLLLATLGKAQA
ncbi:hypothetical protein ACQP1P_33465 [Dactylosporangium sp. CA-052675]|uniref:hypothetical protein n=1 Tax=Dactylosporangium sp. CA-052675 TaxID=3239927 RepID=UPI003D8A7C41